MSSKERPILFSGSMVRALLSGTKTQTRRIVKERPGLASVLDIVACGRCPYGEIGDRLWVRETSKSVPRTAYHHASAEIPHRVSPDGLWWAIYREGWTRCADWRWRPSIHMPRWASRISLEITDVRVQRLNDISEEDAKAEGVTRDGSYWCGSSHAVKGTPKCFNDARGAFADLWLSINGAGSWDSNPWVWAISFKPSPSAVVR